MSIKGWIIRKIVSLNPKRFAFLSDEQYLQLKFYDTFGRFMDFSNPQTFNEKLQWLKIYNRNPEYTIMVDKYESKKYISEKIGAEYIIPTLGVWNSFDEIDFDALPDQFVLKCTHDSGGLVVCRDKSSLDMDAARKKIETSLSNNFYYMGREWPYINVPHRIIAEQYMADDLHKIIILLQHQIEVDSLSSGNRSSIQPALRHLIDFITVQHQVGCESVMLVKKDVLVLNGQKLVQGMQVHKQLMLKIMSEGIAAHHLLCLFVQLAIDKNQWLIKIERK